MAGAKVVQLVQEGHGARQPRASNEAAGPLAEPINRDPIWIQMGDRSALRMAFNLLRKELNAAGYNCDGDLQTDPHEGLKVRDFFEVYRYTGDKRSPLDVGMVTLYEDEAGLAAIKVNAAYPQAYPMLREAVSKALQAQVGSLIKSNDDDIEIVIRQQGKYEPLPPERKS